MNLRQIEVFRAVMQAGSVTGAAASLHVSQPGVSRMLAHIELQLGLTLFERRKGKLSPTPEAETLYAQVEQVYSGVRRIEDCARELKSGGGLSLRVLCSPSLGLELVPRAIAETALKHPQARIYFETPLIREMVNLLATGQADIGLSSLPVHHALIRSIPVGEWALSCVFPKTHAFAAKRSLSPRDILTQHIIAFSPDTPQGRVIQQWCEETGLQPQSRIEVRSGQAACALAACATGVAVVDDFTASAWRDPRLSFRPVRTSLRFPIFALFHATAPTSAVTQSFVAQVQQCFESLRLENRRSSRPSMATIKQPSEKTVSVGRSGTVRTPASRPPSSPNPARRG
jgi:DNA-binding transcriptional LysR family regulator